MKLNTVKLNLDYNRKKNESKWSVARFRGELKVRNIEIH